MTDFDPSGIPVAPPPPPIDPLAAREDKIANDTRVESELNRFIAAKQDALFEAPDAYYRRQGRDAVDGAPQVIQRLNDIRDGLLGDLANDYQRKRLGAALDAQMTLAGDDIARHASEQSKVWQRQVALDRIDLLAKEAAFHHGDDDLVDVLGVAAANAARAHVRVGDDPNNVDRENAAAAVARSRIASAAIQARFDKGDAQGALALFERTQDLLDPAHAAPRVAQLQATQQPPDAEKTGPLLVAPVIIPEGDAASTPAEPGQNENPGVTEPPPEASQDLGEGRGGQSGAAPPFVDASTRVDPPAGRASALIALPAAGSQAAPSAVRFLGSLAGRIAPVASEAAGAAAGAIPLMLTPTNSQGGVIELGDGLRAQWRPGQISAKIERRINDGLFGSGIAADWEELPVAATYEPGPDGRLTLFVDQKQLGAAIGADAARVVLSRSEAIPPFQALPAARPSIYEIRIGDSTDGGASTKLREATDEEVANYCPNYPRYQEIALRASVAARALGLPNGLTYGKWVHQMASSEVRKISLAKDMLREQGIPEVAPEIALRFGLRQTWHSRGSSVLDVLEIYERERRVCVYDFKTGGARFPDRTVERYAREAGAYINNKSLPGEAPYCHIVVIPVRVP